MRTFSVWTVTKSKEKIFAYQCMHGLAWDERTGNVMKLDLIIGVCVAKTNYEYYTQISLHARCMTSLHTCKGVLFLYAKTNSPINIRGHDRLQTIFHRLNKQVPLLFGLRHPLGIEVQ